MVKVEEDETETEVLKKRIRNWHGLPPLCQEIVRKDS